MPKYRFDIQQNTEEWEAIKIGKFSASTCAELLMDKKTKGYRGLIDKIVEERMTGKPCESKKFQGNQFTDRGHELEPVAREDYEMRSFDDVNIVGVVELDDWVLCSPDGLINDNGLYQAKCPIFNTQKEYLKTRKIPTNYYKQMQFELFVSGREYNVFNSYHPSLPPLDIIVLRDEEIISEIKTRLEEAKKEVLEEIKFLKSL
jgi:hypothetical protein